MVSMLLVIRKANGDFDWVNALTDAGLMAAITFVTSTTPAAFLTDWATALMTGGWAALGTFLIILAVKRGLMQPP